MGSEVKGSCPKMRREGKQEDKGRGRHEEVEAV